MLREAVWLSGAVPSYELAEEILRRIGGIHISRTSIWRRTQEIGIKFQTLESAERKRATVLPEQWDPPSRVVVSDQRMGMTMDGAMMNIRHEGWQEVKIGTIFKITVTPSADPNTGEIVELAHAADSSYMAHLGGPRSSAK